MKTLKESLGIQSYCFRGFETHAEVIERLKQCGVSSIELCRKHVDFADTASFEAIIDQYRQADVTIVSIGVESFSNNEEDERRLFEFVGLAGAKHISISFSPWTSPESWRTAEKLADEYDVRLAIHNHGGRHWLGSRQTLKHVFAHTSERIGLCLDTAWAQDSGEDPIAMAEEFAGRLYGVHIKDFVFDRARKPKDVVVGRGNLDLPKLVELIRDNDAVGFAVLEYEGDIDNPVPALKECVEEVFALC